MWRPEDDGNPGATVERLTEQIERLRIERQALREEGAGHEALERNRLALVEAHRALALALIERHAPRRAAA